VSNKEYGRTPKGISVREYTLANRHGVEIKVINYGCTITSLKVPDREGQLEDVVLGFDSLDAYIMSKHYIGSVIGRCANRIAEGRFLLDGKEFKLANNLPPNHLHGGLRGFDKVVWFAEEMNNENGAGILFSYLSPDGDEGYPGNLNLKVQYFLGHDNTLTFDYTAETDQKTIINLTQHSYFNLSSGKDHILNHGLLIEANHFLPVDHTMIPTGEIKHVEGTPFDFRAFKLIGRDIHANDEQLKIGHGYDHNWVLRKIGPELDHAATLYDPGSGRILEVHTTEPGLQLYTANFLDNSVKGKNKGEYGPYSGLCLETQHFPDSPNQPEFPSVELKPGEQYQSSTVWKFSVQ